MPVDSRKPKPGIEAASLSDVGLHRADNEDSYLYWEPDSDDEFRRKGRPAALPSKPFVNSMTGISAVIPKEPWSTPSGRRTTASSDMPSTTLSFREWERLVRPW